ncbi:DUF4864 domain-containing protein [Pontibacter sp. JAM-7]|uniref:DUF4864 domain-containing protein n=1 Tax=Pontibacter sp. JAM-7 TaxID=3366581 RepID=UPI003AF85BA1
MKIVQAIAGMLLSAAILVGTEVSAADVAEEETQAAKHVIVDQITAFLHDDNARAYSHAAPIIRQQFPTVEAFMQMVTHAFKPVWKPRQYAFGMSAKLNNQQLMQQLFVIGPDGKSYEALYTLMLQGSGDYKILAVRVIEAPAI